MPDPIHGVNTAIPIGTTAAGQSAPAQGVSPATGAPAGPVADTADVSGTAALLTTIASAANATPSIDEAKVAALQQAIAGGTYQVDPQQIAKKMIDLEAGPAATGGNP